MTSSIAHEFKKGELKLEDEAAGDIRPETPASDHVADPPIAPQPWSLFNVAMAYREVLPLRYRPELSKFNIEQKVNALVGEYKARHVIKPPKRVEITWFHFEPPRLIIILYSHGLVAEAGFVMSKKELSAAIDQKGWPAALENLPWTREVYWNRRGRRMTEPEEHDLDLWLKTADYRGRLPGVN